MDALPSSIPISRSDGLPKSGRVVTFYSFKGGVGRSMAVANVGALFARWGKKVLMVDFDLEAPGLDAYFRFGAASPRERSAGLVDMLTAVNEMASPNWRKFVTPVTLPNGGSIDLMHAGRDDGGYSNRLAKLTWNQMFAERDLGGFLERWRQDLIGEFGYDYTLIDSRTGITDIGGICTIHLPDILLGFVTTTIQSLSGLKSAFSGASKGHAKFPVERHRLLLLPIGARDESARAYGSSMEWRGRYAQELGEFMWWRPKDTSPETIFDWLRIPYETHWSFGEQLPVLEEEVENPKNLAFSYFQIAQLIDNGFDWSAVKARASDSEAIAVREAELRADFQRQELARRSTAKRLMLVTVVLSTAIVVITITWWLIVERSRSAQLEELRNRAEEAAAMQREAAIAQRQEFERAEKAKSESQRFALTLGQAYDAFGARNYDAAVRLFSDAITLNSRSGEAYRGRAQAIERLAYTSVKLNAGQKKILFEEAVGDYANWVDLDPLQSRRIIVAKGATDRSRFDVVASQAEKLLQEGPTKGNAKQMLDVLVNAQRKAGESSQAGQTLAKAINEYSRIVGGKPTPASGASNSAVQNNSAPPSRSESGVDARQGAGGPIPAPEVIRDARGGEITPTPKLGTPALGENRVPSNRAPLRGAEDFPSTGSNRFQFNRAPRDADGTPARSK